MEGKEGGRGLIVGEREGGRRRGEGVVCVYIYIYIITI